MFDLSDHSEVWIEQPKSLQTLCIQKISSNLLDIQSYDMNAEEQKLKETLEKLPETLQQNVIDEIDIRLKPIGIEKQFKYKTKYSKIRFLKNLAFYHGKYTIYLTDFESNFPVKMKFCNKYLIKKTILSPNASLCAVASKNNITLFSLIYPPKRSARIPLAQSSALTFSWGEEPKLFVTDANGKLTIFSDIHTNNVTRKEYIIPNFTEISSLAIAPNNHYLLATSRLIGHDSFIINLENEEPTFQPISLPIHKPLIAPDSSFFVTQLYTDQTDPLVSIIFKESGRTHFINGEVIAIKNAYVYTKEGATINIFNTEGILQHAYKINGDLRPFYPNNNFCWYSYSRLYFQESLTNKDLKKLIYKIALEKAEKQENLEVLKRLAEEPLIKKQAESSIETIKNSHASIIRAFKETMRNKQSKKTRLFIVGTAKIKRSESIRYGLEKQKQKNK